MSLLLALTSGVSSVNVVVGAVEGGDTASLLVVQVRSATLSTTEAQDSASIQVRQVRSSVVAALENADIAFLQVGPPSIAVSISAIEAGDTSGFSVAVKIGSRITTTDTNDFFVHTGGSTGQRRTLMLIGV